MKREEPFVKRYMQLHARERYTTALSSRYDAWGGLRDNHGQHTMVLTVYE